MQDNDIPLELSIKHTNIHYQDRRTEGTYFFTYLTTQKTYPGKKFIAYTKIHAMQRITSRKASKKWTTVWEEQ